MYSLNTQPVNMALEMVFAGVMNFGDVWVRESYMEGRGPKSNGGHFIKSEF